MWEKAVLANKEWRNGYGNTTGMTQLLDHLLETDTFMWPRAFMWPMPNSKAFRSRLQCLLEQLSEMMTQWPGAPTAPLWDSTKLHSQLGTQLTQQCCLSKPCWLTLLTVKDADQSLCQHSFAAGLMMKLWHLNCPTRIGDWLQAHKRLQRKGEQCSHEERPRQVVWDGKDRFSLFVGTCEKAGSSILLLMVPRPGVVLQMNTPTMDTKQQSHG